VLSGSIYFLLTVPRRGRKSTRVQGVAPPTHPPPLLPELPPGEGVAVGATVGAGVAVGTVVGVGWGTPPATVQVMVDPSAEKPVREIPEAVPS